MFRSIASHCGYRYTALSLRDEQVRLSTFQELPKPSKPPPTNIQALVKAGFYFSRFKHLGDSLRCPVCPTQIPLSDWEAGVVDPVKIHGDSSCSFFEELSSESTGTAETEARDKGRIFVVVDMSVESNRLDSFQTWPLARCIVDKTQLAAAGFYYTGFQDWVCCYLCRVQVGEWEFGDYPATEHIQHSPKCALIPLCKELETRKTEFTSGEASDLTTCFLCNDLRIEVMLIPCGHATCGVCANKLLNCAFCQRIIENKQFISLN